LTNQREMKKVAAVFYAADRRAIKR